MRHEIKTKDTTMEDLVTTVLKDMFTEYPEMEKTLADRVELLSDTPGFNERLAEVYDLSNANGREQASYQLHKLALYSLIRS